jgi:hypothetical protein
MFKLQRSYSSYMASVYRIPVGPQDGKDRYTVHDRTVYDRICTFLRQSGHRFRNKKEVTYFLRGHQPRPLKEVSRMETPAA